MFFIKIICSNKKEKLKYYNIHHTNNNLQTKNKFSPKNNNQILYTKNTNNFGKSISPKLHNIQDNQIQSAKLNQDDFLNTFNKNINNSGKSKNSKLPNIKDNQIQKLNNDDFFDTLKKNKSQVNKIINLNKKNNNEQKTITNNTPNSNYKKDNYTKEFIPKRKTVKYKTTIGDQKAIKIQQYLQSLENISELHPLKIFSDNNVQFYHRKYISCNQNKEKDIVEEKWNQHKLCKELYASEIYKSFKDNEFKYKNQICSLHVMYMQFLGLCKNLLDKQLENYNIMPNLNLDKLENYPLESIQEWTQLYNTNMHDIKTFSMELKNQQRKFNDIKREYQQQFSIQYERFLKEQ